MKSFDLAQEHAKELLGSTTKTKLLTSVVNCIPDIRSAVMTNQGRVGYQSGSGTVGMEVCFKATIADWFCTTDSSIRPIEQQSSVVTSANAAHKFRATIPSAHHSKHEAKETSAFPSVACTMRPADLEIVNLTILFVDHARMSVLLTYPIAKGVLRTLSWLKQYEEVLVSFAVISSVDIKYDVIECIRKEHTTIDSYPSSNSGIDFGIHQDCFLPSLLRERTMPRGEDPRSGIHHSSVDLEAEAQSRQNALHLHPSLVARNIECDIKFQNRSTRFNMVDICREEQQRMLALRCSKESFVLPGGTDVIEKCVRSLLRGVKLLDGILSSTTASSGKEEQPRGTREMNGELTSIFIFEVPLKTFDQQTSLNCDALNLNACEESATRIVEVELNNILAHTVLNSKKVSSFELFFDIVLTQYVVVGSKGINRWKAISITPRDSTS